MGSVCPNLANEWGKTVPSVTRNVSPGTFLFFFSIKTLRLDVSIQDRALHRSKVLSTPAFTLQSILK